MGCTFEGISKGKKKNNKGKEKEKEKQKSKRGEGANPSPINSTGSSARALLVKDFENSALSHLLIIIVTHF